MWNLLGKRLPLNSRLDLGAIVPVLTRLTKKASKTVAKNKTTLIIVSKDPNDETLLKVRKQSG